MNINDNPEVVKLVSKHLKAIYPTSKLQYINKVEKVEDYIIVSCKVITNSTILPIKFPIHYVDVDDTATLLEIVKHINIKEESH